jgi:hypothetical protein
MTEFYEALETTEIFTDEEVIALSSYIDDLAMNKTEYFGIPELYPLFQQHFLRQALDKLITGQFKISFFQKERPKRQPLSAEQRMSPRQLKNFQDKVTQFLLLHSRSGRSGQVGQQKPQGNKSAV